jgi:hypothetical protein
MIKKRTNKIEIIESKRVSLSIERRESTKITKKKMKNQKMSNILIIIKRDHIKERRLIIEERCRIKTKKSLHHIMMSISMESGDIEKEYLLQLRLRYQKCLRRYLSSQMTPNTIRNRLNLMKR